MTKARDLANIISGGFTVADLPTLTANEIPNLDAAKITSGTFADARIAASNVSQHATSFDDNKLVNDISTLALRQASNENKAGYNTNSMSVDVFQDATKITNLTNVTRNTLEYISSIVRVADTSWNAFNLNRSSFQSSSSNINSTTWSGLDTDIVSTTQPSEIGNLGSAGTLKCSTNNNNDQNFWTMDVNSIRWGSDYSWEVLLIWENVTTGPCFPYMGILGGQNLQNTTNFPNTTGTPSLFNYGPAPNTSTGTAGWQIASGQNGLAYYFNLGYDDAIRGLHQDGGTIHLDASDNGIPTGDRILIRLVYDGSANTLKGFINSNNNASATEVTLHGSQNYNTLPTSGYPYWFAAQHNGNANSNNNYQQWYKGTTITTNATGSFEGTTITAPSSVSSMGAIITYQDQAGTNALNTDIVLKLSADNGSNYSTATLTAMPDFSTGIKMAKVNDLSVTAGTQLKYKIEFANQSSSKEARIRGVSLQY